MGSQKTLKVGILGTGKIGTDLLIKVQRSSLLECHLFAGRNLESEGMKKAREMGVPCSDMGIEAFQFTHVDIVFDATSANAHRDHAPIFQRLGIKAIDLTPAKVGAFCVPCLQESQLLSHDNLNMVTCGGQASIPIAEVLTGLYPASSEIQIDSFLSPDSIGPATLANIDDYFSTTKLALARFCGSRTYNVDLHVDESTGRENMLTVIQLHVEDAKMASLIAALDCRVMEMQKYVPGYNLHCQPSYESGILKVEISVIGQGDWIPPYAGNLDIINCAALAVAEQYAAAVLEEQTSAFASEYSVKQQSLPFFTRIKQSIVGVKH